MAHREPAPQGEPTSIQGGVALPSPDQASVAGLNNPSIAWCLSATVPEGRIHEGLSGAALGIAAVVMVLPAAALPAVGITGGEVDTTHTNVGFIRFTTVDGRFRCSGTLISQTVVLTAGHCTEGPATNVYVSFDDNLQPDPLQAGITPEEKAAREAQLHHRQGSSRPGLDRQVEPFQAA